MRGVQLARASPKSPKGDGGITTSRGVKSKEYDELEFRTQNGCLHPLSQKGTQDPIEPGADLEFQRGKKGVTSDSNNKGYWKGEGGV